MGPFLSSLTSYLWFLDQDGTKILSGGADNAGRMFDVTTGQSQQVAQHDAPIKAVKWIDAPGSSGFLVTGSWDKTLKVSEYVLRSRRVLTPSSTGTSERQRQCPP